MQLELRHLRSFVAVAEELNFTRAAERLHIAQQALSAQIRQLEDRLGVQLVERTTRQVELTPAGDALLDHARSLLAGAERAVAAAQAAGGGRQTLTVGFVVPADLEPMRPALDLFAERHPDVDHVVHFGELTDLTGGLRAGHADVALVVGAFDRAGLEVVPLWSEPRGIAMAADHPLAGKKEITCEEFVELPTFDYPTPDPIARDYWMATSQRGGRPPRIVAQFRSVDGLVEAIRSGLGVNPIRERLVASFGPDSGIVFRPVVGLEPAELAIAWRAEDDRPVIADFVEAARAALAGEPGG